MEIRVGHARKGPGLACILALLLLGRASQALAQTPTAGPLALDDLTRLATTIVHARVIGVRVEPHPDLPELLTAVVTLHVEDAIKGAPASALTIRQYVWDPRDATRTAGYRKGQELVLFLTRPSALGLSAPVGLSQGMFEVARGADGVSSVHSAGDRTPVPLARFKEDIHRRLAAPAPPPPAAASAGQQADRP